MRFACVFAIGLLIVTIYILNKAVRYGVAVLLLTVLTFRARLKMELIKTKIR